MVSLVRKKLSWLYLTFVIAYSSAALSFNSVDIEQKLSHEITINPKEVFYKIENLLADTELSLSLKTKLMVMQSEISYIIDQPEFILKYSKAALATGLLSEPWHTRVLISQARGYYQRGQFKEFLATSNMAVIKAEQSNLLNYKIAALVERANAYILLDTLDKANKDLNLALKYIVLLPDSFEKALILERFSAANILINKVDIAKTYQMQAVDIYKEINSPHYLSIGFYNLARIYEEIKDWREASKWMLVSYEQALKDKNKLNQAFSLSRLSEYQNKLQHHESSKKYLNAAIIAADGSSSERVKIHVRKNMATILFQNKAFIECKVLLKESIVLAKKYHMERDRIELIKMLAETYYQLGEFNEAYLTLKDNK